MVTIRQERSADAGAREALLDATYPARFDKPSERLRAGRKPARGLALVAIEDGCVVGTIRVWEVSAGADRPALLLGPLAVAFSHRNRGIGAALVRQVLARAARRGHGAILLVGDEAYYGRFGFTAKLTARLWLPGLSDQSRLLGRELIAGALQGARGAIKVAAKPPRARLIAAVAGLICSRAPKTASP